MIDKLKKIDLPNLEVTSVDKTCYGYVVNADFKRYSDACPRCKSGDLVDYGLSWERLAHTPFCGRKTIIEVSKHRRLCKDCGLVHNPKPTIKYKNYRITDDLAHYIFGQVQIGRTNVSIAKEVGIDNKTVAKVVKDVLDD